MNRELRRNRREPLGAEVFYQDEKKLLVGGSVAKDISESGVCIKIREFLPVGSILELSFKFPSSLENINVKGKIVWINKTGYDDQWEVGLEVFEDRIYKKVVQQYLFLKKPTREPS